MARQQEEERETSIPCAAEEFCDARVTGREETMKIIEGLTVQFLEDIASGRAPEMHLVMTAHAHINAVHAYNKSNMCLLTGQ